ncbi:Histone-lysine N-methyltransferase SETMAR [Eumeta japonica]|uniref:Histone-lysine N-methyltransferase SETMAR n=1 Tax=Eumeta variegata TaxID=151549 RepID=A0A4C1TVC2_EUMVA|nr:Histone-lysine N-methyltransferase SETMAR [Eumeta japonica]
MPSYVVKSCRNRLRDLQSGNFDVKDEPRSGPPPMDKVDAILEKVEQNRHISSYDIAEELGVDYETVLTHLKKARFSKRLNTWVPHEVSAGRGGCAPLADRDGRLRVRASDRRVATQAYGVTNAASYALVDFGASYLRCAGVSFPVEVDERAVTEANFRRGESGSPPWTPAGQRHSPMRCRRPDRQTNAE